MADAIDAQLLKNWEGRQEVTLDDITAFPVRALNATLEAPYAGGGNDGDPLPPLWHWLYFLPVHAQSELGEDGHARKGGFLPPVPLPRRMWAGGRFGFVAPVRIGERMQKTSTISEVKIKDGRSGPLVFVTVRHEFCVRNEARLWEEHDIVYRDVPNPNAPQPAPVQAETGAWQRRITPNDVLLFRYSALTFNGYRIHYDRRYVTQVECYPGLVVHGPLIATLLLDLLLRQLPQAMVASFSFRAVRPTFDNAPFFVNGEPQPDGKSFHLWANDANGWLTMDATAILG
ncbi:MAG: MaoC family dehydratase N-terminal domain-containing protein [Proteobacteria bacterium]|nr:MaoC family dehydratase N-terminal domain-containing protein [Pseudomonadota bacterium]